jgi:class 3 adenylate cyclase
MSQVVEEPFAAGRDAAARGAWREAYDLLHPVASELGPDDLERLAEAAWWTGKLDEAIALREQAHTRHLEAGNKPRAAYLALLISQDYFGKAALAPSTGWYQKAERLLADEPESVMHGYLALTQGFNALAGGDIEQALEKGARAQEFASRFEDRDLQALSLAVLGRTHLFNKNPSEGLRLLDEASAAALSGELSSFSTGLVYCVTITSCNGVGDLRRAAEWTDAANRWCTKQDVKGFPGACRIHHSTLLRLRGNWAEAEEQMLQACDELHGFDAWTTAVGWYEVGEIRRQRGEFVAASEAFAQSKEWARDPQPGLALLRLAEGKADAAAKAIKRSLETTPDPMGRIRRLPAQVEIAIALRDLKTARDAAEELEALVDEFRVDGERTPAYDAVVCLAWGRIKLEENDLDAAAGHLQRALDTWQGVGAPFEAAQVRMLLGRTLQRLGDEDGGRDEIQAARDVFVRLGAVLDAQEAAQLLGETSVMRTFVFTDVVESTKLAEVLGEGKWEKLLAWHDKTLRALFEESGGEVIKQTGDGFFAAFERPAAAVEAAVAIQRALDGHDGVAPDVRIGIHAGGAFAKDERDYGGQDVHVAARIGALAGAGEILASEQTLNEVPARYRRSEAKQVELKGYSEPVAVVSLDWR